MHVESGDGVAKFEIQEEVILIDNKGLKLKDLKLAESILEENKQNMIDQWNKYFQQENL